MPDARPSTSIRIRVRMTARPIDEPNRVSSELELLFDLTFVVAVAAATAQLAHTIAGGRVMDGLIPFLQVFFAIWWAWMNFTWFASSFDTDDIAYRLLTMLQFGWILLLVTGWTDPARVIAFGFLVVCELSVPRWAERVSTTSWHPRHIAERYGLFTIILLGETGLAATAAVQRAVEADHAGAGLIAVAGCGLVLVFALWWLYFLLPAGLEVAVEQTSHALPIPATAVSYAVAVPVAVFTVLLWAVHTTISSVPGIHPGAVLACTAVVPLLPSPPPGSEPSPRSPDSPSAASCWPPSRPPHGAPRNRRRIP